jgi:hypothetical protein
MKIRMYIDLYKGIDPARSPITANSQPWAKSENVKRIAFDVTIPDSLLFEIDGYAAEVSAVTEVQP